MWADIKERRMRESEDIYGLGFHVHVENGKPIKMEFLYETTMCGQNVFCGISMDFKEGAPLLSISEYGEMAKCAEEDGLPSMGELKRITVEDYERDYREDEEGDDE